MQFDSINAFFDMGGYGFFVWLSYGVSLGVLVLLFLSSKAGHKKIKQQIAKRQVREEKLRTAAQQQQEQNDIHNALSSNALKNSPKKNDETNEVLS